MAKGQEIFEDLWNCHLAGIETTRVLPKKDTYYQTFAQTPKHKKKEFKLVSQIPITPLSQLLIQLLIQFLLRNLHPLTTHQLRALLLAPRLN